MNEGSMRARARRRISWTDQQINGDGSAALVCSIGQPCALVPSDKRCQPSSSKAAAMSFFVPATVRGIWSSRPNIAFGGTFERHFDVADAVDAVGSHSEKGRSDAMTRSIMASASIGLAAKPVCSAQGPGPYAQRHPCRPSADRAPVNEAVAVARDVGGKDTNLTIGDSARRPGVLPANVTGRLALCEKAGLIKHQNSVRIDYNEHRPHTSLRSLTPNEFATRSRSDHNENRVQL